MAKRRTTQSLVLLAALLGACSASSQHQGQATGPIVVGTSFVLDSEALGTPRHVNVSVPWGYERRSERFPVLYVIDGGVQQDFVPVVGFGVLATLSAQYREFIVVGVETVDRRYELTTPSAVPGDLEVLPHNGNADAFRRFLVDEVRPFVDAKFRTTDEAALMGESLAGLFVVDSFLREPESFEHYIAVSPSLWWNQRELALSAVEHLRAPGFPDGRSLHLSVADEIDIQAGLEPLLDALEEHAPEGLRWWHQPMPGEHHHTIYHPAALLALRLVFAES